ncbi:MAG: universal stress protein [Polymorphobacter sp.]
MKTILLHIHDDAGQARRLQTAIDLARPSGGHVTCLQVGPAEHLGANSHGGIFGLAAVIDTIRDIDRGNRIAIEARLHAEAVSWSWLCRDGDTVEALVAAARLADVMVLSQPGQGRESGDMRQGRRAGDMPLPIIGDVAVHARAPVLMVPVHGGPSPHCPFGRDAKALLAWNGSAEAAYALRLTMPLLAHVATVHVVEVAEANAGQPLSDAVQFLSRHGIAAERHDWPAKGRSIAVALLDAAAELNADVMVMGAYGHSRLRETVLGGVTRDLIASATLPLLLAH